MNEKEDNFSNEFSSFNNMELQKELLENRSNINLNSKDTFEGLKQISLTYKDFNKSPKNNNDIVNRNDDGYEEEKIIILNNPKKVNITEKLFDKTFLYYLDVEKINEIETMMKENMDKVLSIISDDMNIIQLCAFSNKVNSLNTIIKQIDDKCKNKEILSKLINNNNERGYNSLHYSIIKGNYEIYNILIKNGADATKLTNSRYDNLILACQTKRTYIFLETIKNIIIKQNLSYDTLFEIKDKNNATLLHWSAFSNYNFGVQFLIKNFRNDKENIKFLNYINFKDNNNMTALQYALMNNSHKVIPQLALLNDIDLNEMDDEKRNCYDYSKAMNNESFENIMKLKNFKSNNVKRIIFILLLIIFNVLVYYLILPIINIFFMKYIQLSLNILIIIFVILIKFINPGLMIGNKEEFNNLIFSDKITNIRAKEKEINKYCLYCYIKKENSKTQHCHLCDCCVENILKHDIFLNICIGKKNFVIIIIYKIIFLIYLLFFITIGIFIFLFDIDETVEMMIPLLDIPFHYDDNIIILCSIIVSFILVIIAFFKLFDFYYLYCLKKKTSSK